MLTQAEIENAICFDCGIRDYGGCELCVLHAHMDIIVRLANRSTENSADVNSAAEER